MNIYEECKEAYNKAIENRDRISGKLIPMLTILIAELTAYMWILANYINSWNRRDKFTLVISGSLLFLNILSLIITTSLIYRTHSNYAMYEVSPDSLKELLDKDEELREHYTKRAIHTAFNQEMAALYIEIATKNDAQNKLRGEFQQRAFGMLGLNSILICINYILSIF